MEKKEKFRLSTTQKKFLTLVYKHNPRPCTLLRAQIAKDFRMSPKSVQIWFQNKRAKDNKEKQRSKEAGANSIMDLEWSSILGDGDRR